MGCGGGEEFTEGVYCGGRRDEPEWATASGLCVWMADREAG